MSDEKEKELDTTKVEEIIQELKDKGVIEKSSEIPPANHWQDFDDENWPYYC